jgi:hypothetical protein
MNPSKPCRLLHESPSLRELGFSGDPIVPLTLPTLQILRRGLSTYSGFHLITAPRLHTLILQHPFLLMDLPSAGSIVLPNLRIAIHAKMPLFNSLTWISDSSS